MLQGKKPRQPLKPAEKVAIVVAIITVVGGIITAVITNLDKVLPSQNNNLANANTLPQNTGPLATPAPKNLTAKIERVEVVPDSGGANQIFILLSIENRGVPAAIPEYDILINHVTSKSFEYSDTLETELKGDYKVPQAGGRAALVIHPEESLISKTRVAIGSGGQVSGWLRLVLPADEKTLTQPGTRYTISFTDTVGNTHEAVYVK